MKQEAIEDFAERGEKCDVMKALNLLTRAYISQCGISLGYRTLVYYAAESWQERIAWLDLPLSEMARKEAFVTLMPHVTNDYAPELYDDYDIIGMENDELIDMCNCVICGKESDRTTLEVLSWGILKAAEDKELLSQEIEATAPDGTLLKGILEKQDCSATWITMTEPYNELSISKYELVRDPKELLVSAYGDYNRLREMEGGIRSLYPEYQEKLKKCKMDSSWDRQCVYRDVYDPLLGSLVLTSPERLIEEWFGLKISMG